MYKVIAKLLANRLSSVLDGIIGESQMALVGGRQMVDNIVIAKETIDEAKRNKKPSFVLNLDFERAYDKVCWEFLQYMMSRMSFNPKWRRWINECLQTAEVSILLNGSTTRQVKISKGLRQRDPLFPYRFLLVAEGLNGIISIAVHRGLFEGIDVGNRGMKLSHLQFVDNMIMFGKTAEENIWEAKCLMRTFELVSGLKINFKKIQLMGINVSEDWMSKMGYILNYKQGTFPYKYLRVPIRGNCKTIALWKSLIETFKKKLSSCKGRFLSLGGRIMLLNSVLSSLPMFLMFVHLLPKGLILSLDRIRRNFLWGSGEGKRKISLVCWDKVCRSKVEGGLGIKELRRFNLALLGKWWSRMASENESLLYRVIKEKYGNVDGNWLEWVQQESRQKGSLWWKNICRLDHMEHNKEGWLKEGFKLKMGDGNLVGFWKDVWIGDQPLVNQFSRLFLVSTDEEKRICQMGNWKKGNWQWSLQWRRQLYEWEKDNVIELRGLLEKSQLVKDQKNRWEWRYDKEGVYPAKTTYDLLLGNNQNNRTGLSKRIWSKIIPTKVNAFAWQALQDRIPTKLNLYVRGIITDPNQVLCSLCGENMEDGNHLFIHCRVARLVWHKCLQWWRTSSIMLKTYYESFQQHLSYFKEPSVRAGWDMVWFSIIWFLWIERNVKIFKNYEDEVNIIFELVQLRSFNWIKAKVKGYSFNLYEWMMEPVLCLKAKWNKKAGLLKVDNALLCNG
ncbi:hypothetical protein SLEP1_g39668 [Rubroshorea leprosula]|uniref:Reverse transcriptase domain-containing protein n=1 Tax=Rubroshorea leprosula TaxID=152421 RepID=A0AAV5L0Y2_9ROSI|nr:hypothetical protein SLEP1_g39668 [Rubroshorea leprosula]